MPGLFNSNNSKLFDYKLDRRKTSIVDIDSNAPFADTDTNLGLSSRSLENRLEAHVLQNNDPLKGMFDEGILLDQCLDDHGLQYDCSSSYIESVDPNWFRDESNHKARNITDALSFVKKLGQGVYGDVFLCHLRDNPSKQFAVKRVRQAPTPVENIFGLEQNIVKELHALRSLKRPHVNIVRLYDYCSAIENYTPTTNKQGYPITNSTNKTCIVFYLIFELCDMDLNQFVKENASKYKPHEIDLLSSALQHSDGGDCKIQDLIDYSKNFYLKNKLNNSTSVKDKIPLPALDEDIAKVVMYQLLQGLSYLHSNRIIHRDIKPQNILLKKSNDTFGTFATPKSTQTWQVKIGDLGLSTIIPARYLATMTEEVVTLLYRPPELLLGDCKYTTAVDIWSTAVTVGECLLGKPMFRGRTEFSVLMRIICTVGTPSESEIPQISKKLKYLTENVPRMERDVHDTLRKMFTDHFGRQLISDCGLDLFVKMLQFLPNNRITAEEALKHPWFSDISSLLRPSVARVYTSTLGSLYKGYNEMIPLPFKGNVDEFKKKLKEKRNKHEKINIDNFVAQFIFP
ncbi:protein kinase domain containing protein [Theileria equi strain WA]|uniref:Cyclin-dependent kinase 2 homolog n=1 Tax=Theileria equi strain WA TaxID=1537102 RepID=L0AVX5_THEEQ|nr:protein kinase domain containing protein [Theileria equi strain WA]AFZ79186.1 protein kinase domain containing protein [Theileria equi strain WA]|eukprot:XP_004828852.1 protein kinase domain containing protein [Theileria equi strain WA]